MFRFFVKLPKDAQDSPFSASGMFVSRNVKYFQKIMRNLIFKFRCRLNVSDNDLVKAVLLKKCGR